MYKDFYTTKMCTEKRMIEKRFRSIASAKPIKGAAAFAGALAAVLTLSAAVFASGAASGIVNDNNGIAVSYDGETVQLWNKPFIDNHEVYLPLRETLNACGVDNDSIAYDNGKINIALHSDEQSTDVNAEITVGEHGVRFDIDDDFNRDTSHPVIMKDGVTYAPMGVFSHIKNLQKNVFAGRGSGPAEDEWFKDDFRITSVIRYHLADGLEVKRYYEDGTFDVLLSRPIDVKGENRLDPKSYYEDGERVIVGTAAEQNASLNLSETKVNDRYFPSDPIKRIVLDDEGNVTYIVLVENQKFEQLQFNDEPNIMTDNGRLPEISHDGNSSYLEVGGKRYYTALTVSQNTDMQYTEPDGHITVKGENGEPDTPLGYYTCRIIQYMYIPSYLLVQPY